MSSHRSFSRRKLLGHLGAYGAIAVSDPKQIMGLGAAGFWDRAARPVAIGPVKNLAPLAENAFYLLPVGAIKPRGWLKQQLEIQANGLSGHLDETWDDVGANSGWLGGTGESWERGPYYVDGLIPLAEALESSSLRDKASRYIEWTLAHQLPNGMFGPASNNDWWPRIVMLKALTQHHEVSNDARVPLLMERYFRHQLQELPSRPLQDWGKFRWQDEALSVLWLYNRSGDKDLLALLQLLKTQGHDWTGQYADFKYTQPVTADFLHLKDGTGLGELALSTHGVNNGQAIKAGAVWYLLSQSDADKTATAEMVATLDKYHGLPNGMFSCDEHLAGRSPSQGSELCTVVEYMFSLEQSLAILGDPSLADRLELLAFNALPGTFTADMWAHQYNQQPNQVECGLHSKPWTTDGPESNLFGLAPNFGCCTANFHQGWPKFNNALIMYCGSRGSSGGDGLVAPLYAPCEAVAQIRDVTVRIQEETDYPYQGHVLFKVNPERPVSFPFRVRIPAWVERVGLKVNGRAEPSPHAGTFAGMHREWKQGDEVELQFEMKPQAVRGYRDAMSLRCGPIVFSLPLGEDWVKLRQQRMTADWQLFPTKPWNYSLSLVDGIPQVQTKIESGTPGPLTGDRSTVALEVSARKLPGWRSLDGVAEDVPESPVKTNEAEETITLIPYSMAKLRITSFPTNQP